MSSIDETKPFIPLNIAVLTISDTRSLADDKSGATLADRLTAAGHHLAAREIIVDDVDAIRVIIKRWIARPRPYRTAALEADPVRRAGQPRQHPLIKGNARGEPLQGIPAPN